MVQTRSARPFLNGGMTIAYFGTGLLGAGFVRRQLDLGTTVRVWNRSPEKARALVAGGAVFCDDPATAVAGADQLHLTLSDDASVDAVLEPLASALATVTIVDHTTTAPTPTAERIARWKARGIRFVHAPVFMGPANTREGSGIMMTSCSQSDYDQLKPMLETMTGKLIYLGDDPIRAAAFKLFGNMFIVTLNTGLGDIKRLAGSLGISPQDAFTVFDFFNPATAVAPRAKKIASGDFTATWELTMARKDTRLMLEEAGRHDVTLAVVPAIAAAFDDAIKHGYGALDSTAVAKLDGRA
jgi:3-hydroxyisobutyrate dehydrogenase